MRQMYEAPRMQCLNHCIAHGMPQTLQDLRFLLAEFFTASAFLLRAGFALGAFCWCIGYVGFATRIA